MVVAIRKEKPRELAIGYIRQSDEREDKEDISEQTQLIKIQQYCDYNDLELVAVFKDIDYSGFRIPYTKRPDLMNAFEYLKNNRRVKKFVCFNLSRLTRRKKDFALIHESLENMGIDICSAAEQLDFGSPTGRLVASILVDFNEYYSDNLSDVTVENKKTNAEKGRWNGGPAPFGLIRQGNVFVEDGKNAEDIKTMFRMAKKGSGPFVIAKWAKEANVYTQTGVEWSTRRVRYVLTNPTYAAMQEWDGEFYPLKGFAKLVEWEDFIYIQRTLFGNEKAWRGNERQMLTTIMRCPVCNRKMFSRATGSGNNRRYVCVGKNEPGGCPSASFDLHTLNTAVINLIAEISLKRYSKTEILEGTNDDSSTSSLQNIRLELERLDQAKHKVFDDYYVNGVLTEQDFERAMTRFERRQAELQKQLEKLPMPTKKFGDFDDILSELGAAILDLDDDDKRKIVELIIAEIVPDLTAIVKFRWGETFEIKSTSQKKNGSGIYYF